MQKIGFLPLFQKDSLAKRKFLGRPLFCWVLAEAIFSNLDKVVIATNNADIKFFITKNYDWTKKIKYVPINEKHEALEAFSFFQTKNGIEEGIYALLNSFSPFLNKEIIDKSLHKIIKDDFDSAISVVELKNKIWDNDGNNLFFKKEVNMLLENAAIFCTRKKAEEFEEAETAMLKMPIETLSPVSEKNWETSEKIMADQLISEKELKAIKFLVLDVDGVFTDGGVFYDENGELTKRFDIRDGMGLEILREHNVEVVVMTSEDSAVVKKRMEKLKIKHVFLFAKDKHSLLENFIQEQNISRGEIAYIGDDVNDLANLCSVGWSFAPQNATNAVKPLVDIILSKDAGTGAIREATERILIYNKRFKS